MAPGLIVGREVKVDVWDFFGVEAKEDLERDGLAIALHLFPAFRALLLGEVEARADVFGRRAIARPFEMMAMRAKVMWGKRVDLGDLRHGRGKRRADRATGADEVAIIRGFLYQKVGDPIGDRVAVADDTLKLFFEAVDDFFVGMLAINLMKGVVAKLTEFLRRAREVGVWLIKLILQDLKRLASIRDLVGVGDDDLFAFLFRQPGHEGIHHLLGGTEMLIGVGEGWFLSSSFPHQRMDGFAKAFRGDVNIAEDLVFRVHVMAIARRADHLAHLICRIDDSPQNLDQSIFVEFL